MSFGAEAVLPDTEDKAEDEGWRLVRHFKFHLHPSEIKRRQDFSLEPLPSGLSLIQIYTDYMAYLLNHTKIFFGDHVLNGSRVWESYHQDMTVVFAHPNGWGIREQGFLRRAAIAAGFVMRDKAHCNIQFVSEAEASVHFCMFHSDLHEHLNMGVYFVVCDAGGSTTDTTAYYVKQTAPALELDETKASACVQAGGVSVDAEFQKYLFSVLNQLGLSEDQRNECMRIGCRDFEENVKKAFDGTGHEFRINLGGGRTMNHPNLRISRGKLTLNQETVLSFFNESIETAVDCIRHQMDKGCEHVLLVGGFGESLYLRNVVNSNFSGARCSVTVTSDPNAKAVADGSVLWCAKRTVVSRATRMAYGIEVLTPYDRNNVQHCGRTTSMQLDGIEKVSGFWSQIVSKGTIMEANEALRGEYHRSYDNSNPSLGNFTVTIYGYNGAGDNANTWLTNKNDRLEKGFEEVCQIRADLSGMRKALKKQKGTKGKYYRLDFKVAIQFGDTEMKAFLEWEHGGKTSTGPAEVLPNELSIGSP
ncbi:Heat shock 70 kDa protein 12A [Rhizoctonia solani AG-1 IB]|uniref:Heat shock 70 kDa protein 12A n=1 Tax=Thanatephorus cucumeris (strain AG1-IB / isolate 7/3/14) TaxID=1108050 RepID=M5C1L6_THACB|nr:Heat shock 70 kDa protein 12A [Rhizoctonia solani AG-1 IB]